MASSTSLKLDFATIDVFTRTKYAGNPLAIVRVPKNITLTQDQKQIIAREFNLSETTFLHEQESGSGLPTWTVDIFMTTAELPFAGHPTIGTACFVLSEYAAAKGISEGVIEGGFKIKAGPIGLQYDVAKKTARAAIPHDIHVHKTTWSKENLSATQSQLAEASRKQDVNLKDEYPVASIVKGMTFILIELENEDALGRVATTALRPHVEGLDDGWDKTFVGCYFYVRYPDKDDGTRVLRTRMIEGTLEDSATGSAASDLAGYLSLLEGKPKQRLRYEITQGVEMGRKSDISLEVVMAESEGIETLYLEGSAVEVMEGRLTV
ncbi:Diaminopimelate epimerase-like protein [Amniculicola lignicola CBS 123094]|uniref:Diaminopimelate epimerase-like protein n=1 Tax=Amniculicola lignicola CBS 123094 TaxID=1392246 RepID=A0A6A5WQS3_9PLEO|nr:Diaminopimelate epimerase-like protein [Amniculicola lignicola CBS 123094]